MQKLFNFVDFSTLSRARKVQSWGFAFEKKSKKIHNLFAAQRRKGVRKEGRKKGRTEGRKEERNESACNCMFHFNLQRKEPGSHEMSGRTTLVRCNSRIRFAFHSCQRFNESPDARCDWWWSDAACGQTPMNESLLTVPLPSACSFQPAQPRQGAGIGLNSMETI